MKRTFLTLVQAIFMIGAAAAFQACFYSEGGPPYYEPGGRTVVLGDYDDNHQWHDRYWWATNDHDWVHAHHPDWVQNETHEEHEAYEHHKDQGHDHDHDHH
jgi:hypothetical protein